MSIKDVLFKNLALILIWGLVFMLVAVVISLFLPKQYKAQSEILIISRDQTGIDPYTQAKSAERVGENLAQIIKTSDFHNKILKSDYSFDKKKWTGISDRKARKKWNKDVHASVVYGTGLMKIDTYSETKTDAAQLSQAISQGLADKGWEYVGSNVIIKVVSNPLMPIYPSRPNYLVNALVALLVGVLLSSSWIIRYKKHHHLFG